MMKKLLLVFILICTGIIGFSQNYSINFNDAKTDLNGIKVNQNDFNSLNLSVNFKGIDAVKVNSQKGEFCQLILQGSYRSGKVGYPQLPSTKKLIEIPFGAEASVKVLNYDVVEYQLSDYGIDSKIIPFQPSYPKNMDPSKVEFIYNEKAYSENAFRVQELAQVNEMGIMRGITLAQLTINPIQYNPGKNIIRVYNNLEIEVSFKNANESKTISKRNKTYSPYFESTYKSVVNTKDNYTDNPDHTKYPVKYLIVTDPAFEDQLSDFVDWKTKKGFEVIMVTTDEIGNTSAAIKAWIHEQYNAGTENDPAPTFFLLVGDTGQIPASQTGDDSGKATDLYYACVDGANDIFPDMYYGRFSAQTSTQLQNMLNKVLYYEKYEFSDPEYLNEVTLIAGADGTWNPRVGQPTINYGTENYFNTENGFTTINTYLDSYSGCYDSERINVGLINYTAHCSETSWGDPSLSQSAVNAFTNVNKYPLAIGNCCLAADFGTSECMGETWMRKANGGSVAYIGSSPSSYWWEDYYWSVGAHAPVDGVQPTFEGSTLGAYDAPYHSDYLCVDALIFVGNLAVSEAHDQSYETSISLKYYWEAYNCLSDPSIFIYLTEGSENTVSHLPTVPIGVTEYEVSAEPGSYVAISKGGILYGAALVPESGVVNVSLTPITEGGDVSIVVTKSQYKPYMTTVPAAALNGPYLAVKEFDIIDESGNGEVEFGELFNIDLTLKNVGSETAETVTVSITSEDKYIETSSNNIDIVFPNITAEGTATVTGSFNFSIKDSVPDGHMVALNILITDSYTGKQEYASVKNVKLNAPKPRIKSISYNDDFVGNNVNGIIDAGETGEVIFEIENAGHANLTGVQAELSLISGAEYLTLNTFMATIGNLMVSPTVTAIFNITASENAPLEEHIPVNLTISGGSYVAVETSAIIIGEIPIYVMGDDEVVSSCSGTFYDSGDENGDYSANENLEVTFMPSIAGNILQFYFESFNTESGYDYLYVYNGENSSAEQIAGSPFAGNNGPTSILANNNSGALTFKFTSDGSVYGSGWKATFECIDPDAAPLCAENIYPGNGDDNVLSTIDLSWAAVSGAVEYDVYFGETLPTEPNATISSNTYKVENLDPYTEYSWKIVPKNMNGDGPDSDCGSWIFTTGAQIVYMSTTTISTCEAVFTDDGGMEAYANGQNTTLTFMPGETAKAVSVTFSEFDVEEDYDYLEVFNGSSVSAPLIGKYDGSNYTVIGENGTVTANNVDGALTFHFYSDGIVTGTGWVANLSCVDNSSSDTYKLTFNVTDANGAIDGAVVTIGENFVNTNSSGIAEFHLEAGNYSYSITANDHMDANGSVEIVAADLTENVEMTIIGVKEQIVQNLQIYPNPSNGKFIIEGAVIKSIEVFNVAGISVTKRYEVKSNAIELNALEQGIYFIQITTNNDVVGLRKISIIK